MKWDKHIDNIVNKTQYLVSIFYQLRKMMSKNQLLQLYCSLFDSTATYGVIGWVGLCETTYIYTPLQRLQGKILKIIGVDQNSKSVHQGR